jgi:hypothetical protein
MRQQHLPTNALTTSHNIPYFAQWESVDLIPKFLSGDLPASRDPRWSEFGV